MAPRKAPPDTLVLLVRHGATPTTGRVLPGRAPGLHLSEEGLRQAAQAAERLATAHLDAILCSPLERARETAEPTAAATGLPVVAEPGLLETDVGEWTGESLSGLARRKEWRAVLHSPSTFRFPGGESFAEVQARVVAVLERLQAEHPAQRVACFSHADAIRIALNYALGAHLDAFGRIEVGPGSVSAIRLAAGSPPTVVAVNSRQGPLADPGSEH